MQEVYVVLDNVRSAYNVGSIFRTAEGAGVKKIWLAGYTPAPRDRFGRVQPEIEKTSLGASTMLEWKVVDCLGNCIEILQADGVTVVAVEQTPSALPLAALPPVEKVAYVFGNEIVGIPPETCARCDYVVALPMMGQKESLNVSVAAGIVLYHQLIK